MKKRLILAMAIIVISAGRLCGQTSSDIYIIGTSVPPNENVTGFKRFPPKSDVLYKTPQISFLIRSLERDYQVWLGHYDYDLQELAKIRKPGTSDSMKIVDKPLSELSSYNVIDVAQFLATKTKAEVREWVFENYLKRVWVIDRNDFYKSSPSLPANDRMKLIEVDISTTTFPSTPVVNIIEL